MLSTPFGGNKKAAIEIDLSIWREEIGKRIDSSIIWREDIGEAAATLDNEVHFTFDTGRIFQLLEQLLLHNLN